MIRYFLFLLLLSIGGFVNGQNLLFPPYFTTGEAPVYGAYMSDTLINAGSTPAKFYFNYESRDSFGVARIEKEKIFYNDSVFVQWLATQAKSTDAEERLVEYVSALAHFYKSERNFKNYLNIAQPAGFLRPDSGYAKMGGLTGSNASFRNQQCGDYARRATMALYMLHSMGLDSVACKPSHYRQVNIAIHSVFEIWYHSKWAMVDIDPGTGGFMFPDGHGAYYSLQDILDVPTRATANWVFLNDDNSSFTQLYPDSIRNLYYQSIFYGVPTYTPTYDVVAQNLPATYALNGTVVLPPNSSLVFNYNHRALAVNLADYKSRKIMDTAIAFINAFDFDGDDAHMDSFYNLLAVHYGYYGISTAIAEDITTRNAFGFYSYRWLPVFEQGGIAPPILSYYISSAADTLKIGTDVAGPFVVVGVNTNKPMLIENTLIADTLAVELWDETGSGGPVNVDDNKVNFLTSGFILPNTNCRIDVAYNPGYIDWWNGYSIDQLGQADTLTLRRTQNVETYNPTTAISSISPDRQSVAIRLTAEQLRQLFPGCGTIVNVSGQSIPVNDNLPAGLYFMNKDRAVIRLIIVE